MTCCNKPKLVIEPYCNVISVRCVNCGGRNEEITDLCLRAYEWGARIGKQQLQADLRRLLGAAVN